MKNYLLKLNKIKIFTFVTGGRCLLSLWTASSVSICIATTPAITTKLGKMSRNFLICQSVTFKFKLAWNHLMKSFDVTLSYTTIRTNFVDKSGNKFNECGSHLRVVFFKATLCICTVSLSNTENRAILRKSMV